MLTFVTDCICERCSAQGYLHTHVYERARGMISGCFQDRHKDTSSQIKKTVRGNRTPGPGMVSLTTAPVTYNTPSPWGYPWYHLFLSTPFCCWRCASPIHTHSPTNLGMFQDVEFSLFPVPRAFADCIFTCAISLARGFPRWGTGEEK